MNNSASLKNKQSVDATDQFLTEYTAARTGMIEQGLIVAHGPKSQQREVEDIKKKLEGPDVLKYMMELPELPREVDDLDPTMAKGTILGRMRQCARARRGPGLAGSMTTNKSNSTNDSNLLFQKSAKEDYHFVERKGPATASPPAKPAVGVRRRQAFQSSS